MDKGQAFDTCSLLDEQIFLETGHRNRYMGVRRILQGLILDMHPKVIVEIGVFRGHTTACMALTAEKVGARIYAIDPNMSRRPGRIAMEVAPQTKVVILEKKAENVKREDIKTPIDLLFLDGDHTYEGTKSAFERFIPWMRIGGLMVLHDVTVRKTGGKGKTYGAWKFWDEIQYPKFLLVTERPGIGFVKIT